MDELITLVKSKTLQIVESCEEVAYEEIVELVDLRQRLLQEMQRTEFTEADQLRYREHLGGFFLEYDNQVIQIAERLKHDASKHLRKFTAGTNLKHSYEAGYDKGSLFFDKKK